MRRRYKAKPKNSYSIKYRSNEQIRIPRVLVIDENGVSLGEMDTATAIATAKSKGLDLIEVSPNAHPAVCRISDYGKLQYAKAKQNRQQKAKQKKTDTKGIRLGVRTDSHDLDVKKGQAEKFLSKGHKVKIEMRLRGREKAHEGLARKNIEAFIASITVPNKTEEPIKRFPGGFNVIIAPE